MCVLPVFALSLAVWSLSLAVIGIALSIPMSAIPIIAPLPLVEVTMQPGSGLEQRIYWSTPIALSVQGAAPGWLAGMWITLFLCVVVVLTIPGTYKRCAIVIIAGRLQRTTEGLAMRSAQADRASKSLGRKVSRPCGQSDFSVYGIGDYAWATA